MKKDDKSTTIYTTNEWKGYGKQNYYRNEYRLNGDEVTKFKCNRHKSFDGRESNWCFEEKKLDSWKVSDSTLPDWLKKIVSNYI